MSKAKMEAARELIKEKRYNEARAILKTVDHPTATRWLQKLERMDTPRKGGRKARARILYRASPSMFRNRPILFLFVLALSFALIGIPFLLLWWLSTRNTLLTVTNEYIRLRHGILSRHISEIYLTDIRNIRISQGPLQRMLRTGVIEISTASASEDDIVVSGLPHPYKIKHIINYARRV